MSPITIQSASKPQWANADKTAINCEITASEFGDEVLPFTASISDPEAHGRELFADLVAGKHGTIADYVPPPAKPTASSGTIPTTTA